MSHLTYLRTNFKHLGYLEQALTNLNIAHSKISNVSTKDSLVIPQTNNYDVTFSWNFDNQQYEMISDYEMWAQPYSIDTFLKHITSQYAREAIIGEGNKAGFLATDLLKNTDGSTTIKFERWNNF